MRFEESRGISRNLEESDKIDPVGATKLGFFLADGRFPCVGAQHPTDTSLAGDFSHVLKDGLLAAGPVVAPV